MQVCFLESGGLCTTLLWAALLAGKYENDKDAAIKAAVVKMKCRLINAFKKEKNKEPGTVNDLNTERDVYNKFLAWKGKNEVCRLFESKLYLF